MFGFKQNREIFFREIFPLYGNSKKHFWVNHFQEVINIPISLPFVRNSNLSGQKHTPERVVCVRLVRHFNISNSVIPLFRYSAPVYYLLLFLYYLFLFFSIKMSSWVCCIIPLFRYSALPYSVLVMPHNNTGKFHPNHKYI